MLFLNFMYNNKKQIGILKDNLVYPLSNILGREFSGILDFIDNFSDSYINDINKYEYSNGISINDVKILSPIPEPKRNIICVGKNYKEHIKEVAKVIDAEHETPEYPVFFTKMVDKTVGPNESIELHKDITDSLDYEAELAVIIGKTGSNIPKEKVHKYIFGYTILNDISARDIQRKHKQWFRGKSLDNTCPIGPYILHKSSISYPPELNIKCSVNGEVRQNSNTKHFIFNIDSIISELSKGITLKRGDIISTGTPSGVGMGMEPKGYLKSGDVVECCIESIGCLKNIVK